MSNQYAIVELKPHFVVDSNNSIYDISTGNVKIDKLVETRLLKDHTRTKSILWDPYKAISHSYNPKTKIITLKVKRTTGKWSMNDAEEIRELIEDLGPDTWMEGDIGILNRIELKDTKYKDKDYVELGLSVKKIDIPVKIKEVSSKLRRKVSPGEEVDISDFYTAKKESKPNKPKTNNKYITNAEDLDSFAKSIGWFDKEPSEYTGVGNYKTRKSPSSSAKEFDLGTKRLGLDGNQWIITQTKNGIKRWARVSK